jgi:hypothetical protein
MSFRRKPIVRSKPLLMPIDGCSPGAVIDASGWHNTLRLAFDGEAPRAFHALDIHLESLDPCNEGPDGRLSGFAERKAKREAFLASLEPRS